MKPDFEKAQVQVEACDACLNSTGKPTIPVPVAHHGVRVTLSLCSSCRQQMSESGAEPPVFLVKAAIDVLAGQIDDSVRTLFDRLDELRRFCRPPNETCPLDDP